MKDKVLILCVIFLAASSIPLLLLAVSPLRLGFFGFLEIPGHITGTVVLALAFNLTFLRLADRMIRIPLACAASLFVWLAIEGIQEFVPGHGAETVDILADIVGALIGAVSLMGLDNFLKRRTVLTGALVSEPRAR
jgi:hypothetical protein